MGKKTKCDNHNWTPWELEWNKKFGRVWQRRCLRCGEVEQSRETPIEIVRSRLRALRTVPVFSKTSVVPRPK